MCCLATYISGIACIIIIQVNAITKNVAYPEFVFDDAELLQRSKSVSKKFAMLQFYTLMFCKLTMKPFLYLYQIETTGGAYFDTFAYAVNENIQKNLAMLNQPVDRDQ